MDVKYESKEIENLPFKSIEKDTENLIDTENLSKDQNDIDNSIDNSTVESKSNHYAYMNWIDLLKVKTMRLFWSGTIQMKKNR